MEISVLITIVFTFLLYDTKANYVDVKSRNIRSTTLEIKDSDRDAYVKLHNDVRSKVSIFEVLLTFVTNNAYLAYLKISDVFVLHTCVLYLYNIQNLIVVFQNRLS